MNDEQKKFDMVEIVLLMMLALINDGLVIFADLGLAIPVVGLVLAGMAEAINVVIWGIILFWFIMKLGFSGRVGIFQIAGGIAEFFGIPGRSATVAIGIYIANHPKAAAVVGKVAVVAGAAALGAVTGGAGAVAAVGAEAGAATGAVAAEGAAGAATAGAAAETGAAAAGTSEAGVAAKSAEEVASKEFGVESLGEVKEMEEVRRMMEEIPETTPSEKGEEEEKEFEESEKKFGGGFGELAKLREGETTESQSPQNINIDEETNSIDLKKAA
jgi:hypothetical protein